MDSRSQSTLLTVATVVAAGIAIWLFYGARNRGSSPGPRQMEAVPASKRGSAAGNRASQAPVSASRALRVVRLDSSQVLATVNGHEIKLQDLVPLKDAGPVELSPEVYQYFLDRAVNRELIFEAVGQAGIQLSDGQRRQLEQLKSARNTPEPGGVAKLNRDAATVAFELRDAQAFMLQTSLLAGSGASPDVSEQEALDYYQGHVNDYGALPDDASQHDLAWQQIDAQIRNKLAPAKRQAFERQVSDYMDALRTRASIGTAPPEMVDATE